MSKEKRCAVCWPAGSGGRRSARTQGMTKPSAKGPHKGPHRADHVSHTQSPMFLWRSSMKTWRPCRSAVTTNKQPHSKHADSFQGGFPCHIEYIHTGDDTSSTCMIHAYMDRVSKSTVRILVFVAYRTSSKAHIFCTTMHDRLLCIITAAHMSMSVTQ